jgi:hypothetical protein
MSGSDLTIFGAGSSGRAAALDDNFSSDRSSEWTVHEAGTLSGLVVSGGVLSFTGALDHDFHHSSVLVADAKHVLKINPATNAMVAIHPKWIDANNWFAFQYYAAGANIDLVKKVGGSVTGSAAIASSVPTTIPFWMVARVHRNRVVVETYQIDPLLGANPVQSASVTLSGGDAAALGAGVSGKPGLRVSGYDLSSLVASTVTVDDWIVVSEEDRTGF